MIELPLADGWGEKVVKQFSPASLVNMYVDVNNTKEAALISRPGLGKRIGFTVSSSYGVRAMFGSEMLENMHIIVGDSIYQLDSSLNPIFGRKINTAKGVCSIADIKDQVAFTDGESIYIYNTVAGQYSVVTSPSAPPKPGAISVMGGRAFINEKDTAKLHISDIYDATSWSGNVVELSIYNERIITHGVIRGRLFLLGTRCGNVWYLSDTYPYIAMDGNLLLEYGCAAAGSLAIGEDRMVWLGKDRQGITSVVVTTGGVPEKISSDEIEAEFQKYDDVSDADAFIFKNSGIIFYLLNFTKQNKSFLYNFNTLTWSELSYGEGLRYLASAHAVYNGQHYVGAFNSPFIYKLDNNAYVDYDLPIKRKFTTRAFYPSERFIVHKVRVIMEQGTGNSVTSSTQNSTPELFLRVSRDNGITFGNALEGEVGKIGRRETICDYYRLGYCDFGSLVFDFEHYSPTPCNIFKILVYFTRL